MKESDAEFEKNLLKIGVSSPGIEKDLKKFWDAAIEWRGKFKPLIIHLRHTRPLFSEGRYGARCGYFDRYRRGQYTGNLSMIEDEVTCKRCIKFIKSDKEFLVG